MTSVDGDYNKACFVKVFSIFIPKKYLQTYLMFFTLLANCGKYTVNELKVVDHNIRSLQRDIFTKRTRFKRQYHWDVTYHQKCILPKENKPTTPSSNNMSLLQVVFVYSSSISGS